MLIVDTGPLVAYLNANDPDHVRCATLFEQRDDQLLVTPYVVTEACYLVAKYVGPEAEAILVESILEGDLVQVDIRDTDLSRIVELMRQYRGFPLGLADSSVVAVAERLDAHEVVTLDRRHFHAIVPKHVNAFTLLP
ncbi:type II toxin-antitoxin system VapC family toxin [Nocardia bovistercoris]|uniref:Ribonuclease VapC n=1 Tax=Nocardia bovistercoris TaxID=2785916 RepID=A0A931I8M0_9NOCA|nr:PIN domain-containing protein [Nocardia bovistercoris]MBH0775918.1 PIN domain-containing protein [Nocardia bovistercoris]